MFFGLYISIYSGILSSLELRVQFCLLVCCTYPSSSTVNKEKNLKDQRASLRVDTRETTGILQTRWSTFYYRTGKERVGKTRASLASVFCMSIVSCFASAHVELGENKLYR